jgi:H2-forming N5,N10-methylenetetrahydromethanopterin dehydrogenase-like enzyme
LSASREKTAVATAMRLSGLCSITVRFAAHVAPRGCIGAARRGMASAEAGARVVLVVGGAGQLGEAMVSGFKADGAFVVSADVAASSNAHHNVLLAPSDPAAHMAALDGYMAAQKGT